GDRACRTVVDRGGADGAVAAGRRGGDDGAHLQPVGAAEGGQGGGDRARRDARHLAAGDGAGDRRVRGVGGAAEADAVCERGVVRGGGEPAGAGGGRAG